MKVVVNYLTFKDVNVTSTCGGAVVNYGALTVKNCLFTKNKTLSSSAGAGAGISNTIGGTLYVEKCEFCYNESSVSAGSIITASNTITYISDCVFKDNIAPKGSAINNSGNMTVKNCTFNNNSTSYGTVLRAGYGTVYSSEGKINLINCIFDSNDGTYCSTIANDMNSSAFVANTLFINNKCSSADSSSATIFNGITSSYSSTLTLVNNTITDNNTVGIYNNKGIVFARNNIVCNNASDLYAFNGGITATNNLIGTSNTNFSGNGNIFNSDPLFVGNGNYSLQATSPAIDAGSNSYLPDSITFDLNGNKRISKDTIDMGAYEFQANASTPLTLTNEEKIYSSGLKIFIKKTNTPVSIFNIEGQLVAQGAKTEFQMSNAGIYIVCVGNIMKKVIVK